ncbi:hypothetical protein [Sporolactobacillus vineae]|uniref:hypothetical protein n=1 Tax=Sporolactobacillus vineae TaxID=444463 RepID=UPI0002883040|nr:hypothetical protein [Sporolactobacillus vineae]
MKKILTAITIMALLLGACGHQQNPYDQAIKQGQKAVQSEHYTSAQTYFRQALDAKRTDRTALAYLNQLKNFQKAVNSLKKGDPESAINAADRVLLEKNGSGTLIRRARTLKDSALAELSPSQSGSSGTVTAGSDSRPASSAPASSAEASSSEPAVSTAASSSDGTESSPSSVAADAPAPAQSGGTVKSSAQKQAETAVVEAAGYSRDQVYVSTRDSGVYYSIELRESHSGDSATDPNTAPSIGFFRYYKSSGKITKLDIISNQYKPLAN